MDPAATDRLIAGRYQLNAAIGRGGMGVVWRARDLVLGREVAVKELAWPASLSPQEHAAACRRAVREARVAARLSHRNVVRVFDIFEEDGSPWIVMELLSPRSLGDLIRQHGPLSPVQAARMGLEILAALRAAHALGIVHRDVKPANILMMPDRAVLADFGIARSAEASASVTTGSVVMGSPAYIAPERARGGESGPRADLWGLGACLYAAVEGRGPFERDAGPLASLSAVIVDEAEPAAHAGPLLEPVISGLLRKDPGDRLGAVAAEEMLRAAAAPGPGRARVTHRRRPAAPGPDAFRREAGSWRGPVSPRRAALAAAVAGAGVAAAVGLVISTTMTGGAPASPRPATAPASFAGTSPGGRHVAVTHLPANAPARPHLAARTSPGAARLTPTSPAAATVTQPAKPGHTPGTVPPGQAGKPPKPAKPGKPGKPGEGNGKGNG